MRVDENSNGDIVLFLSPEEGKLLSDLLDLVPSVFIEHNKFIKLLVSELKKCEEY